MQSSGIIISSPFCPLQTSKWCCNGRKKASSVFSTTTMASRRRSGEGEGHGGSWMVDENMIVLRKRIHEMKKKKKSYVAPCDWMGWEKDYYDKDYDSVVCEAMGILQTLLMNTRPSLAFGILALIALSVPVSSAFLLFHFFELGHVILKGISP